MRVLITGGAGFVGSHTADALLNKGYHVRVFDNLDPQVHGVNPIIPQYLDPRIDFVYGDVRDRDALLQAIKGVDALFHLAAAVGVGQSMYEVHRYVDINSLGGATLLDILTNEVHQIKKVIVASSMSIYGEGQYNCSICGTINPPLRPEGQLAGHNWEVRCSTCGREANPIPTNEDKPLRPNSIYAITKRDHEEMFLTIGRAYQIPTVALRYFNIYGSRQALSNPYTGVAAIFSSRLLNNNSPLIFEDGFQSRDFIHVSDIVRANILALENNRAKYDVFNVGTGHKLTINDVANTIIQELSSDQLPEVLGEFRQGDIRHCYADITKICTTLGYTPNIRFEQGVNELVSWVKSQSADDHTANANAQLEERNLII